MSRIAVSIADWNPSESEFDECIKLLDSEPLEQRKILSKTRKDDRIRSFVGRILIRFALSCHSGLNPSEMRLSRSAAGKPFLIQDSDAPERLGFNLSHEGDWVALAFSIGSEQIGCDLAKIEVLQTEEKGEQKNESIQKQLMFIQSFEKILTADEMKNLRFLQEIQCWADHIFLFYALWTVKEAFSKAIGQGLLLHFKVRMHKIFLLFIPRCPG